MELGDETIPQAENSHQRTVNHLNGADASTALFACTILEATGGHSTKEVIGDPQTGKPKKNMKRPLSIWQGTAHHVQLAGLAELATLLPTLKKNYALIHGVPTGTTPGSMLPVVTQAKLGKPGAPHNAIARTLDHFGYADIFPLMFDIDPDPYERLTLHSAADLMVFLTRLCPAFADVGYLATTSTSSAIYDKQTGVELIPPHGMHVYVLAQGDIVCFREWLKVQLWRHQTGYCRLATPNKQTGVAAVLERCLTDLSVFSPERLDYVSGAEIAKQWPFEQRRPAPALHEGLVLDLDALPALTQAEREEYTHLLQAERARVQPERFRVCTTHIKTTQPALDDAAVTEEAESRIARAERNVLAPDHVIHLAGGRTVLAQDITAKHDRIACADPMEPDYGPDTSKIFWQANKQFVISSWAHGVKKLYRLEPPPSVPPDTDDPEGDLQDLLGQVLGIGTEAWTSFLILTKTGTPSENVSNISLLLEQHKHWHGRLWFDTVRQQPMLDNGPLNDTAITVIGRWLGTVCKMPVRNLRLVERCALALCLQTPRDLLREWIQALPAWDKVQRLTDWLSDVAEVDQDAYAMNISRLLPVSLIARAMHPGCQYRNVVILEGTEDSGKSKLVRTLASPAWYVELSMGLESKEAHMMLQGAWVAELAELDSLSRTEETRLKSFLTMREDTFVPKYSNFRTSTPRRTIFVGTSNEQTYLKGQSGNTRFLPIKTGTINVADLEIMREQLFAEALTYYQDHPTDWWQLTSDGASAALKQREQRRVVTVYENDLGAWLDERRFQGEYFAEGKRHLFVAEKTSWEEIARHYLQIDTPEGWHNITLQKQIASALRALGWEDAVTKDSDRKSQRFWRKVSQSTL